MAFRWRVLVLLGVAISLTLTATLRQTRGRTYPSAKASATQSGLVTPDLVGRTRTDVICALRDRNVNLVVDGFREHPRRRVFDGICRGTAGVQPDPAVRRQSPAPGSRLRAGDTVRVWTPCFRVRCL